MEGTAPQLPQLPFLGTQPSLISFLTIVAEKHSQFKRNENWLKLIFYRDPFFPFLFFFLIIISFSHYFHLLLSLLRDLHFQAGLGEKEKEREMLQVITSFTFGLHSRFLMLKKSDDFFETWWKLMLAWKNQRFNTSHALFKCYTMRPRR